jgi:hypothetical protein
MDSISVKVQRRKIYRKLNGGCQRLEGMRNGSDYK